MADLIEKALARYKNADFILQMKARFFFSLCLVLLVIIPFVLLYSAYTQINYAQWGYMLNYPVLLPQVLCLLLTIIITFQLVRGRFAVSAHLMLIVILLTIWTVIFLDRSSPVSRLDSIVLCVGLLTMTPLVVTRHKNAILLYGALNIIALMGYMYLFRSRIDIPDDAVIDYLADNSIAFIFVSVTAYYVFTINKQALDRAEADIRERQHAEEELAAANEELSVTIDQMHETNREYEEANVKLQEAQQEIVASYARLRLSEEKFSKAFHLSPLIMSLSDLTEGRFIDVSEHFARLTEYTREEMIGKSSQDLNLWADPEDRARIMATLFQGGILIDQEIEVRSRSGKPYTVLMSAEVITIAETPHLVMVGVDITGRKQAEQEKSRLEDQLRQSQKMESIGRLAGGVAHDFNNLLTAILGNTGLALMGLDLHDPLHSRLKVVMKAAESASELTRQLLAFSRKQIIAPKPVCLGELIDHMHKMLGRLIGEDIRLEIATQPHLGMIEADPGQIEQIIVNLAVNARDAMQQGGRLFIETANVTLDEAYHQQHPYTKPGDYVLLAVRDTGCGMSDEAKAHLFEPFFTTKPLGKGTGLGLATVYGAVKQNGGSIEVDSEPGHGTTVRMYFPRQHLEGSHAPAVETPAELPRGTETILLVEDDPHVREFTFGILSQLGYTIMQSPTGEEALAIVGSQSEEIHLLLTDVILPGMNGRALAEELLQRRSGLKVLYTSGYTADVIVRHGVLEEGIHFLGKPYTAETLAGKVREVLEKS